MPSSEYRLANQAAVPMLASALNGLAPAKPACAEVEAQVAGRNWNSPDAPE